MLFRFRGSICLLLAASVVVTSSLALGDEPQSCVPQERNWESRIEAALDAKGAWEFVDAPLSGVITLMQETLEIDITIDTKAFEDDGIDLNTPITRSLSGVSNRSFLQLMLRDLDLTFTNRYGTLWITNSDEVESRLTTRVYPIGELLQRSVLSDDASTDYDFLLSAITSSIEVSSWDVVGGPAAIGGIYDSLVVSQTLDAHAQVKQFLTAYRDIVVGEDADQTQTVAFLGQRSTQALREALDKSFTAEFKDEPLSDVLQFVSQEMDIPVILDSRSLEDFGIDSSIAVTGRFNKTPLRFVLARLLHELELAYTICDEVLLVTTPEVEESTLTIGLYPVRSLVQQGDELIADSSGTTNVDFDSLIQAITSTIAPETWDEVGGPGAIEPLLPAPTLVISQTQVAHDEIVDLLTNLRLAKWLKADRVVTVPKTTFVRSYPLTLSDRTSDEIAALVIRDSEAGTWNDRAGAFVQGLGSSLIVKHEDAFQHSVQRLLLRLGVWSPLRDFDPLRNGHQWCPAVSDDGGRF